MPKGRSDGVWALGAAGTNSFQQSWLTEADRLAEGGCQRRQGKGTDKHILELRMRPRACLRLPVLIKRWPPWPVWGKEGQSGWEGQSKRGTGWTRGGGGLSKWCAG